MCKTHLNRKKSSTSFSKYDSLSQGSLPFLTFAAKGFEMITGISHLHSILRWVALIVILIAIVQSFKGFTRRLEYTDSNNRWSLFTLIAFHLQLVLGFVLYFSLGWHRQLGNMSDDVVRFWSVEHMVGMLVAIALVTIGRIVSKKNINGPMKHKRQFWFFFIALIIVVASIPWPWRELGIARGLFPGM